MYHIIAHLAQTLRDRLRQCVVYQGLRVALCVYYTGFQVAEQATSWIRHFLLPLPEDECTAGPVLADRESTKALAATTRQRAIIVTRRLVEPPVLAVGIWAGADAMPPSTDSR